MFDTSSRSADSAAARRAPLRARSVLPAVRTLFALPDLTAGAAAAQRRPGLLPATAAEAGHAMFDQRHDDLALWLTRMLDEIDYGMLLVDAGARVTYMNHTARQELDGAHPLRLTPTFGARRPADVAPLFDALAAARRGQRGMLMLGGGAQRVSMSVVPLPSEDAGPPGVIGVTGVTGAGMATPPAIPACPDAVTLLVLGKRQVCERLSVQGFARSVQLTAAETRVLELLCAGMQPTDVAQHLGVALSTVRTQINHVRAKTGARSIREVVRQVAVLPPLVGSLR